MERGDAHGEQGDDGEKVAADEPAQIGWRIRRRPDNPPLQLQLHSGPVESTARKFELKIYSVEPGNKLGSDIINHMDLPKLAAPAMRALASIQVESVENLARFTEKEITDLHGMGPNALGKLKEAMKAAGVEFKPS